MAHQQWHRFVAIGDSTTEGLNDLDPGGEPVGFADRLAAIIAAQQGGIDYANLAIRGKETAEIRAEQVPPALAMKPDLVSVLAGMNDLMKAFFDPRAIAAQVEALFATFRATGATVITFTLPDPTPNLPLTSVLQPRLRAFNDELRAAASRTGTILAEIGRHPSQSDPRVWSDDRLHGNSIGHEIIAHSLAHALGLPGYDGSWREPLPPSAAAPPSRPDVIVADVVWAQRHAIPWLWRGVRGTSTGDGRAPKHPQPIRIPAQAGPVD